MNVLNVNHSMRGPGIFSFKVLESPGKVLEFCSVISVATLYLITSRIRLTVLTLIFIPVASPSSDYSYLFGTTSHLCANVPLNPHSLTHSLTQL